MMKFTFGGIPITVLGKRVEVGDQAKDFTLLKNDMSTVTLKEYDGKIKVLNIVPSLDTGVCDTQTRRFNADFKEREDVVVITVSNDLPFAQARWCGNAGLPNAITLSAHRDEAFATDYGVLIKEFRLLSRTVIVLDKNNKVTYVEYVLEGTNHPNYKAVFEHLS
ncbi:MAG: thiol peroxidase [Tenericutes bacterium]|nr:thiol peroxidase [Mycoplasmatota bacterium]